MLPRMPSALEIRGAAVAPIDEPLRLRLRGAGDGADVVWRARLRDDEHRVWRARAATAAALDGAWTPAKTPAAPHASLASLRPVRVEIRAELSDGRAAARTVTRTLLADGVRVRRWRGQVTATLVLPVGAPASTLLVDATAAGAAAGTLLAAALLAGRGVLVLVVGPPARGRAGDPLGAAADRLAAVPGATEPRHRSAAEIPLPPGIPAAATDPAARAAAWARLLAELGATPPPAPAADTSRP